MNDISRSVITGRAQNSWNDDARRTEALDGVAAARTLHDNAGKRAMNVRRAGHTKTALYTITNLVGGVMGQLGDWATHTSYMGKSKDKLSLWGRIVQDIGQTHMNATQDAGVAINTFNKGMTHTLGQLGSHALLFGFWADSARAGGRPELTDKLQGHRYQVSANVDRFKRVDVDKLGNMKRAAMPYWSRVHKELQKIDDTHAGLEACLVTGSEELQGAYYAFGKGRIQEDEMQFYRWASVNDKALSDVAEHQVSKFELAVAYDDFLDMDGPQYANLAGTPRTNFRAAIEHHVDTEYLNRVRKARNDFKTAEQEFKAAQKEDPRSADTINKHQQMLTARQHLEAMRTADDAFLSPEVSQELKQNFTDAKTSMASMLTDNYAAFKKEVGEHYNQVKGHDTKGLVDHGSSRDTAKASMVIQLKHMGFSERAAGDIANETYKPLTELSKQDVQRGTRVDGAERELIDDSKLAEAQSSVDAEVERRLELAQRYSDGLNELRQQTHELMIEKGMPEKEARTRLDQHYAGEFAKIPNTEEEMKHILVAVEENIEASVAGATSELEVEPPEELDRSGNNVVIRCDERALAHMSESMNLEIAYKIDEKNVSQYYDTDENSDNFNVARKFEKEVAQMKFTVNGETIADPAIRRGKRHKQVPCGTKLTDQDGANVDRDHLKLLTHLDAGLPGLFQELATTTDDNIKPDRPTSLTFAHESSASRFQKKNPASVDVQYQGEGVYRFVFEHEQPLSSVSDGNDLMSKPFRTDPTVSRNTTRIEGTINVNAEDENYFTVESAETSYNAVPQATKYRE